MDSQSAFLKDLDTWPRRLCREERDIDVIGSFTSGTAAPFLSFLVAQGLARRTLDRHRNHLFRLADCVLTKITQFPRSPLMTVSQALDELLSEDEGPLLYDADEDEQREFDATCKKLFRYRAFLVASSHISSGEKQLPTSLCPL